MATMADEKTTSTAPPHDADYSATSASASFSKDDALGLVGEHAQEIDPLIEARVLRKIDWFLIPAMIVGTSKHRSHFIHPFLQSFDKLNTDVHHQATA
jgi:hypothetical protein